MTDAQSIATKTGREAVIIGKTLLTMRSTFATAEELENGCERFGVLEGGKQTLERLGQYVTQLALRVAQ